MSFESVEKYIRDLEALKQYPEVKRERGALAEENAVLKDKVAGLEKEVVDVKVEFARESERRKAAGDGLEVKASLAEKLEAELGGVSEELKALKDFEIKSTGGRNLTLEQAREEFLKAQESEIERRANEKFEVLKADLETKMPGLVHDKLVETLGKQPWPKEIAGAIESKAGQMASEILRDKERWPSWFKEFYLKEVKAGISTGLNIEFERGVEKGATERAGKLSDLEAKIKVNAIRALEGPWRGIKCDRCGVERGAFKLTEDGISDMLTMEYIELECINPHCEDLPAFRGRRRHKIRISIRDLIAAYIRG